MLKSFLTTALLIATISLGCKSNTPITHTRTLEVPEFSITGKAVLVSEWWHTFEDQKLDQLIKDAFENNRTIKAALFNLEAAEALARRDASALFPNFDGFVGLESTTDDSENSSADFWQTGLAASYEVDLWGRLRSEVGAETLEAEAVESDFNTLKLTIAAQTALTWYSIVESRQSIALLRAQVEANKKMLDSLHTRFKAGTVLNVDILRQKQLSEETSETLIIERTRLSVLEHQLAILLGKAPQAYSAPPGEDLPALPALPATGLPAELTLRRPDLQASFLRLQAADATLASAIRARYPRINISAELKTDSINPSEIFEDWVRSVAADLVVPIFDGSQRRAEVDRSKAVKSRRLAEFTQANLLAFKEVEDALVREVRQIQRLDSLEKQSDFRQQAYQELQSQYFRGAVDFIDVITAQTDSQETEQRRLKAQRELIEIRIGLYRALAGKIESTQPKITE